MIYLSLNLRNLREEKGLSIRKLSKTLGISRATIRDNEQGRK